MPFDLGDISIIIEIYTKSGLRHTLYKCTNEALWFAEVSNKDPSPWHY